MARSTECRTGARSRHSRADVRFWFIFAILEGACLFVLAQRQGDTVTLIDQAAWHFGSAIAAVIKLLHNLCGGSLPEPV
jgi:lipid-A-disaccharide synthase-like uncharacterized protein